MRTITDHLGLVWTRSEDGKRLVCQDGRIVNGEAYMPDEHLLFTAYLKEDGKSDYPPSA